MTESLDFAMPVSFTLVRQAGNDQLMRVDGGDHYRLEGPSLVSASWSGPQKAEIWHHHNTGAGFHWRKLAEFNGGGRERLSESGQNPGRKSWCTSGLQLLRRMWPRITEGRSRFIRSSSWGGGVGDDTTRSRLDALPGHPACQYGGRYSGPDRRRSWAERHGHRFLATCRCASNHAGFRRGAVDVALRRVASLIRDEWAAQGPNRPSHHGHGGNRAPVRFNGGPVEANAAGRDDFPDSCVLVPAVAQGVAA